MHAWRFIFISTLFGCEDSQHRLSKFPSFSQWWTVIHNPRFVKIHIVCSGIFNDGTCTGGWFEFILVAFYRCQQSTTSLMIVPVSIFCPYSCFIDLLWKFVYRLLSSGFGSMARFWAALRGDHLSTRRVLLTEASTLLTGPSASRRHHVSAHDHGRPRSDCIEPSPCRGARRASDPVDRDPGAVFEDDPHPRSSAGRLLEPWVCRHTREPTVLSRVSTALSLNSDRSHQPCPLPWRTLTATETRLAWAGRDRWGLSSPYYVATTSPCGQPGTSSLCDSADVFATVPRQDVNSPFHLSRVCHLTRVGVCTHAGSGPSRVRRHLLEPCLGDPISLASSFI